MAAGKCKQFFLLLWKNWIIQRRKICCTVTEIVVPVLLSLILVLMRQSWDIEYERDVTVWPSFDVDALPYSAQFMPVRDETWSDDVRIGPPSSVDGGLQVDRGDHFDHAQYDTLQPPVARSLVYAPDTPRTQQLMTSVTQRLQLNQSGACTCVYGSRISLNIMVPGTPHAYCRDNTKK